LQNSWFKSQALASLSQGLRKGFLTTSRVFQVIHKTLTSLSVLLGKLFLPRVRLPLISAVSHAED
jgi:hypothetical protein